MNKVLSTVALTGVLALSGAVPALAVNTNTYPAPPANAAVSDGTVGPGETFVFSGRGFLAGETIVITVTPGAESFTTTADANGNFAFPMSISEPGVYTLTATGQTSGTVVSTTITVTGETGAAADLANSGNGSLAETGADASLLLWGAAGIGALGLGAGGVIVSRRRTKAAV